MLASAFRLPPSAFRLPLVSWSCSSPRQQLDSNTNNPPAEKQSIPFPTTTHNPSEVLLSGISMMMTTTTRRPPPLLFLLLYLFPGCPSSLAQQPYVANKQLNCYATNASSTLGYACNGNRTSCASYFVFRSDALYQSPVTIGFLLGSDPSGISALNDVANVSPVPAGDMVLVPAPCSCSGGYYQHNASYTLQGETYLVVANNTYQGLSTCQALMAQNPYPSHNLSAGLKLLVPLRCACPTRRQIDAGARYLLTYLVTWGDDVSTIAARFHASEKSVLDANGLSENDNIFPFTTLLVPLSTEPTRAEVVSPSPPAASPKPVDVPPSDQGGGSSKKGIFIGIGVGAAALVVLCAVLFRCVCWRRRRRMRKPEPILEDKRLNEPADGSDQKKRESAPLVSDEIRIAIESMTVYRFEELEEATGSFAEDHRIKGSVYRGMINGDAAAIKRLNGGGVMSNEISILKQINHANVIRLSGICLHQGDTYLVYEYAENGSLGDWLHHRRKEQSGASCLSWRQRVQIAYDVADALSYLHNYTNPPYVHKDLNSSNILLDSEFRGKVGNLGLARPVKNLESLCLTRHVVGTQGYMAPEYLEHGLITPKLDVFAFGVVVLELLSGKEAAFPKEGSVEKGETLLWTCIEPILSGEDVRSKLRSFLDPCLRDDYPFDLAFAVAQLAMRCISRDSASRPAMTELLVSLSAVYNSTLDWDPSDIADSDSTLRARCQQLLQGPMAT